MLACPHCNSRLTRARTPAGVLYLCNGCRGRAVAFSVLRREADPGLLRQLRLAAYGGHRPGGRACPHCAGHMAEVSIAAKGEPVVLDVCAHCHVVWFDSQEYGRTVGRLPQPVRSATPPPPPRQAEAEADDEEYDDDSAAADWPDSNWKVIPGVLAMPVEMVNAPMHRAPAVTWTLTALIVGTFVVLANRGMLGSAIGEWGFIPEQWARHSGMTLLTSFFLHVGVLHLVGNLYFFLMFGDNVEDQLGRLGFVALLVLAHLAGAAAHSLGDPRGDIPCVGASGGISGVLAYYAVAFPRARIGIFFWFLLRWLRFKAIWMLLIYVALQVYGGSQQIEGGGGTSYLAHIGGLAVGVVAGLIFRRRNSPRERY